MTRKVSFAMTVAAVLATALFVFTPRAYAQYTEDPYLSDAYDQAYLAGYDDANADGVENTAAAVDADADVATDDEALARDGWRGGGFYGRPYGYRDFDRGWQYRPGPYRYRYWNDYYRPYYYRPYYYRPYRYRYNPDDYFFGFPLSYYGDDQASAELADYDDYTYGSPWKRSYNYGPHSYGDYDDWYMYGNPYRYYNFYRDLNRDRGFERQFGRNPAFRDNDSWHSGRDFDRDFGNRSFDRGENKEMFGRPRVEGRYEREGLENRSFGNRGVEREGLENRSFGNRGVEREGFENRSFGNRGVQREGLENRSFGSGERFEGQNINRGGGMQQRGGGMAAPRAGGKTVSYATEEATADWKDLPWQN